MDEVTQRGLEDLSLNELRLLKFIKEFQETSLGRPPSYREIMVNTSYKSTSHVQADLKNLTEGGYLVNVSNMLPGNKDVSRAYVLAGSYWTSPEWFGDIEIEETRRRENSE